MDVAELVTVPQPARFSVEDFLVLDRAGSFAGHAKTELIDGTILVVNAQYSGHMKAKVRLLRRLADACDMLRTGLEACSEGSVEMGAMSMPEPDIFVTTSTPADGPVPVASIALIVEVADTTPAFDLGDKARLYAAQQVPEYWVIDLPGRIIHQMWSPGSSDYARRRERTFDERIAATTIAGLAVEAGGLI